MKKINLGQTIGIVANLGVIAGIVFLGVELRQNNALLGYDKSLSALNLELTRLDMMLENPRLRLAFGRMLQGSEPSQELEDELLFTFACQKMLYTYEWQFMELPDRRDRLHDALGETYQIINDATRKVWIETRPRLNSELVSFFEDATGLN